MDPFEANVRGVRDLVASRTNKISNGSFNNPEGEAGDQIDALSLKLDDAELLKIRDDYEARYAPYEGKMKAIWEQNKASYLGKDKDGRWIDGDYPEGANLQFEAEETFLPAALSKNPEPTVYVDNSPEGVKIAKSVKTMLAFHTDQLVLRRKLSVMVRLWSIYHLGVLKHGWRSVDDIVNNSDIGDIDTVTRKIKNFVFDPEGYVDEYGDFIGGLGERIDTTAEKLIDMFPEYKDYISIQVDGKLGTKVIYTEWWSADNTFTFITFKDKVLDKYQNPFFNYPEPVIDPVTGQPDIDPETGEPVVQANNHFSHPRKPYTFLSVFSLQEQPHDITGLIEQNIGNQKKITRRSKQIDFNASSANNSYAFSEDNFNQETAKQAASARAKGNPILIPVGGPIDKAIMPLPAQDLPPGMFTELEITKNDLRSSWGIVGITSSAEDDDNTVRGEIIEQANDTSRIGGGIGDSIEQVCDSVFNWWVQLYTVFYDTEHFAAVMGKNKAVEYVSIVSTDLNRQLVVSVSPDSLKPKDEVTEINMAQALFDKGAIGPKTLLTILDFPDPDTAAADGVLYKMDPMLYMQLNFPESFAQMQEAAQQQMMSAAAGMPVVGGSVPPEGVTEPAGDLSRNPVDTKLSQIQMPSIQQGGAAG